MNKYLCPFFNSPLMSVFINQKRNPPSLKLRRDLQVFGQNRASVFAILLRKATKEPATNGQEF